MTIPFAYVIVSDDNELYVGSRYGKNVNPSQLLSTYFTSSKYVRPKILKNKAAWKILRIETHLTAKDAVAAESAWQHEFKKHPGILNRRIINKDFIFHKFKGENPNAIKWVLQKPNGTVITQGDDTTKKEFFNSLGINFQVVDRCVKRGSLPMCGAFAGWKILSRKHKGVETIYKELFAKTHGGIGKKSPKLGIKTGIASWNSGKKMSEEFSRKISKALSGKKYSKERKDELVKRCLVKNNAHHMHNSESHSRISRSGRLKSKWCNSDFDVTFNNDTIRVNDLLEFADTNSFARNTIRLLADNPGKIASQGRCKGMFITKVST